MKVEDISTEMNEENYAKLAGQLNTFMRSVGLENMQGQVITDLLIPAGTSVNIAHSLKVTPKYRIILRQRGGGTIIDGDIKWSETSVSLKNSGADDATLSIFLIRG